MRIAKWSVWAILAAGCGATPLPSKYGASEPCIRQTCAAVAPGCGVLDDGCGATMDCGACGTAALTPERPTVSLLPPPTVTAAQPPPPPESSVVTDAVRLNEVGACRDGVDNDEDGRIDDLDTDCGAAP